MLTRPTRKTRSMININVNDHPSKEFSFCDPEKKFKDSTAISKSRTKTNPLEKTGNSNEVENPPSVPNKTPNVIRATPGKEKTFFELIDGIEPVCRDFIDLPGKKNYEVQDITSRNLEEQGSCDENEDTNSSTESKADPRMGSENDKKFEKSRNMENSIFSPNNSAGNRNIGKATKSGQIKMENHNSKIPITLVSNLATEKFGNLTSALTEGIQLEIPHSTNKVGIAEDNLCDPRKTICGSQDDPTRPCTLLAPMSLALAGSNEMGVERRQLPSSLIGNPPNKSVEASSIPPKEVPPPSPSSEVEITLEVGCPEHGDSFRSRIEAAMNQYASDGYGLLKIIEETKNDRTPILNSLDFLNYSPWPREETMRQVHLAALNRVIELNGKRREPYTRSSADSVRRPKEEKLDELARLISTTFSSSIEGWTSTECVNSHNGDDYGTWNIFPSMLGTFYSKNSRILVALDPNSSCRLVRVWEAHEPNTLIVIPKIMEYTWHNPTEVDEKSKLVGSLAAALGLEMPEVGQRKSRSPSPSPTGRGLVEMSKMLRRYRRHTYDVIEAHANDKQFLLLLMEEARQPEGKSIIIREQGLDPAPPLQWREMTVSVRHCAEAFLSRLEAKSERELNQSQPHTPCPERR